jgi:N-acetylneuraminic acid mutarotase
LNGWRSVLQRDEVSQGTVSPEPGTILEPGSGYRSRSPHTDLRQAMTRFPPLYLRLTVGLLGLAACSETTGPTPETASGPAPAATSLALASNTWTTKRPLLEARSYVKAAAINNVIYVVGGRAPDGFATSTLQAYNVTTNTWSTRKPLPSPRAWMNGASVIKGRLYATGGYLNNTLFVYIPGTNTWVRQANMPAGGGNGAQGVIAGLLYVYTPYGVHGHFWRYDPATDKWTTLPTPPHLHDFPAAGVMGGKFYLAGGADQYVNISDLDVYDPGTNTWTTKAPMPWRGSGMASAVIAGKFFVAGGVNAAVYDPGTNRWTARAPMPTARTYAAGAAAGGRLFVIGGASHTAYETRKVEVYTP